MTEPRRPSSYRKRLLVPASILRGTGKSSPYATDHLQRSGSGDPQVTKLAFRDSSHRIDNSRENSDTEPFKLYKLRMIHCLHGAV